MARLISLRMPEKLLEELDKISKRSYKARSVAIREAILEYIERRAGKALGSGKSAALDDLDNLRNELIRAGEL